MKKVKIIIWLIIILIVGMIFYQNKDYFLLKNNLIFSVPFVCKYQTPALSNAVIIVAFFLAGLLISYCSSLHGRFKANKTIKKLSADVAALNEKIASQTSEDEPTHDESLSDDDDQEKESNSHKNI